jgi:hypothetical protein
LCAPGENKKLEKYGKDLVDSNELNKELDLVVFKIHNTDYLLFQSGQVGWKHSAKEKKYLEQLFLKKFGGEYPINSDNFF